MKPTAVSSSLKITPSTRSHPSARTISRRWPAIGPATDIRVRDSLGWVRDLAADEAERVQDRERMLTALVADGALSSDEAARLRKSPRDRIDHLILAGYRYVAHTPSVLTMVQIEDVFALTDAINVPGTVTEQPNWRRRLPIAIEDFELDESFLRLTQAMQEIRSGNVPPTTPSATYRIQYHAGFTFRDSEKLVAYLSDLGVSHLYASPILKARSGQYTRVRHHRS